MWCLCAILICRTGPSNGKSTAGACEKTGVCSSIGPVPYFKASGKCLPCPAEDDLGTPLQMILMVLLLVGGGGGIWLSTAATGAGGDVEAELEAAASVGKTVPVEAVGPILESVVILMPTFQFLATAFSCDFSWPVLKPSSPS